MFLIYIFYIDLILGHHHMGARTKYQPQLKSSYTPVIEHTVIGGMSIKIPSEYKVAYIIMNGSNKR